MAEKGKYKGAYVIDTNVLVHALKESKYTAFVNTITRLIGLEIIVALTNRDTKYEFAQVVETKIENYQARNGDWKNSRRIVGLIENSHEVSNERVYNSPAYQLVKDRNDWPFVTAALRSPFVHTAIVSQDKHFLNVAQELEDAGITVIRPEQLQLHLQKSPDNKRKPLPIYTEKTRIDKRHSY
jgi:predicted nucleic acid-binding protein